MAEKKFGADLCTSDGGIGGHIFVSDSTFLWKPVRFLFIGSGVKNIEFPITQLDGYVKSGLKLSIGFKGYENLLTFYTWKGQSIISAIQNENPDFHMYSSDDVK
jgi:hypothetical protein